MVDEVEEGTPEDIHRQFFSHLPSTNASIVYITLNPPTSTSDPSSGNSFHDDLRLGLSGAPIPSMLYQSLPTHLGLHDHADTVAWVTYTRDDVLLSSRSTAQAQRSAVPSVFEELVCRLGE